MSQGRDTDHLDTIRQLTNPCPVEKGKTWLRHGIKTQAGLIDRMILDGKHSKEDMVRELETKTNCRRPLVRLERHLDHLQNATGVDAWTGNIPHKCKIKELVSRAMVIFHFRRGGAKVICHPLGQLYLPV